VVFGLVCLNRNGVLVEELNVKVNEKLKLPAVTLYQ
jgi:hypothetical protein